MAFTVDTSTDYEYHHRAMASDTEYRQMDDEELTQLQEAYRKLGQPMPASLEDELEIRVLAKELREDISAQENNKVPGSTTVADDLGPAPVQEAIENRTGNSMNRRRLVYLRVGLFLVFAATLFPPWSYKYPGISYGFLFRPPDRATAINLTLLFVEWVLIALVMCGLFLAQGRPSTSEVDQKQRGNSLRNGWHKQWMQHFRVPIITVAAICAIGLGYYASRRIVRDLPSTEVSKVVVEQGYIDANGSMELDIYNGSEFLLTEIKISISVFDDKRNAIISNRVYRVPAYDFYPQQSKKVFANVGFALSQNQKWEWLIVGARGRPK